MSTGANHRRKVLLVGWDGADAALVSQLVDASAMPALAGLIERGTFGTLSSAAPMISPLVWTSIATGKRADQHGVLNWTEPDPTVGVLRPISATARTTSAVWDILSHNGLKAHVVNWYATHPAEPVNGTLVSDRFAEPVAPHGEPWPVEPGSCFPSHLEAALGELRMHPGDLTGEHLLPFVPRLAEIDQQHDPRVIAIAAALAEDVTVHAAATHLLEREEWDLLAVHYRGLERWGHDFMRYVAPRMSGVSQRDCDLYGDVVAAGYRFHDMMLARLLQLAGDDATVVLVSDHGFRTGGAGPRDAGAVEGATDDLARLAGAARWHGERGVICMSGPGLMTDELLHGGSVIDVAPTILTLFGLPVGDDMDGRPLLAAWEEPPVPKHVPSWDVVCGRRPPAEHGRAANVAQEGHLDDAIAELTAQGYADALPDLLAPLAEAARRSSDYHLAIVHLAAARPERALVLLEQLHAATPDDEVATFYLAYCHYLLGAHDACRSLLSTIDATSPDQPMRQLLLAMVSLSQGRPDDALPALRSAEETRRRDPTIACFIGHAYLQLSRHAEAELAFRRALDMRDGCAAAHVGLALSFLRRQSWQEAADAALRAVAISHHQPEAHFVLGVALTRMGRASRAIVAFENAIAQRPGYAHAHAWLASIHDRVTGDPSRTLHHRRLAAIGRERKGMFDEQRAVAAIAVAVR